MAGWSMVAMVGVVAGPTVGGILLEHFWWGSIFLLNVPIAVLAIIGAVALIPSPVVRRATSTRAVRCRWSA